MNSTEGRKRRWLTGGIGAAGGAVIVAAVIAAAVGFGPFARRDGSAVTSDQAMANRAAQVMPFDLEATTHTFTKDAAGGIETVVAKDPSDTRNIDLVRSHLALEADAFRKGNFSDPARIHGMDMPGVKDLEVGASRVDVVYETLPGGGRITYSSTDPVLVSALHAWFDRQTTDHAMPGMGG